eukprot:6725288-Alexandrium_andersonii.AAC.1
MASGQRGCGTRGGAASERGDGAANGLCYGDCGRALLRGLCRESWPTQRRGDVRAASGPWC